MLLADPAASRAVLIGVHTFERLPALPAVANNLRRLREILTEPGLWGLSDEHCTVIEQPQQPSDVLDPVRTAADEVRDTLFVYYAGHGLTDPRATDRTDKLCLSLAKSDIGRYWDSVRYRDLRGVLMDARRAPRKVVVLDCCFSGQAAEAMGPGDLGEEIGIHGAYVLTSAGASAESKAFTGEKFTAFTGEFLSLLENGVPDGPELLTLDTLYAHVRRATLHKGLPEPRRATTNTANDLALVRNRAYAAVPPQIARERRVAAMLDELVQYFGGEFGREFDGERGASPGPAALPAAAGHDLARSAARLAGLLQRPPSPAGPEHARAARAFAALLDRRRAEDAEAEARRLARDADAEARRLAWEAEAAARLLDWEARNGPAVPAPPGEGATAEAVRRAYGARVEGLWLRSAAHPPVARLARGMGCTHGTADDILEGRRFPDWRQLSALLTACGIEPRTELDHWSSAKRALKARRRVRPPAARPAPVPSTPQARRLADALRGLLGLLRMSGQRYALTHGLEPETVLGHCYGVTVPSWQFVAQMLEHVRQVRGCTPFGREEELRALHDAALRAEGASGAWRAQGS